jgi:hypothetical protein
MAVEFMIVVIIIYFLGYIGLGLLYAATELAVRSGRNTWPNFFANWKFVIKHTCVWPYYCYRGIRYNQ